MALEKDGYVKPAFRIRKEFNEKLKEYLFYNKKGSISKYVENAVINQLKKDGIISQDDKNWYFMLFDLTNLTWEINI